MASFTADGTVTYVGRVKWYNDDVAHGFISVLAPLPTTVEATENEGCDPEVLTEVFVHRSELKPKVCNAYNAKLITGEVVQFEIIPPQEGKSQSQAINVRGMFGGDLICDFGNVEFTHYTREHFKKRRVNSETAPAESEEQFSEEA